MLKLAIESLSFVVSDIIAIFAKDSSAVILGAIEFIEKVSLTKDPYRFSFSRIIYYLQDIAHPLIC